MALSEIIWLKCVRPKGRYKLICKFSLIIVIDVKRVFASTWCLQKVQSRPIFIVFSESSLNETRC